MEATILTDKLSGERCAGDDRRFLDRHRDQDIAAVDAKVGCNAEWKLEGPDDILDHLVGSIDREHTLSAPQGSEVTLIQPIKRTDLAQTCSGVELVETGDARVFRAHR